MIIESISFVRLLNSEHLSLALKLLATVKKHLETLPELNVPYGRISSLIEEEVRTFEVLDTSLFTEEKMKADSLRDGAARQLLHSVRAFEYSDDTSDVEASNLLYSLLKEIPAIVDEANERKTIHLFNLVSRLSEEPFASAAEHLSVKNLIEKLEERNNEFNTISLQQTATDSAKNSGNMHVVRKPVNAELRRIFRIIENRFDLETADEQVKKCVAELNYDIREAQAKMKQRMSRNRKEDGSDSGNVEPFDAADSDQ